MAENLLHSIYDEILILIEPIKGASNDSYSLETFFRNLGWNFNADSRMSMPSINITHKIKDVAQSIEKLNEIVNQKKIETVDDLLQTLNLIKSIFEFISTFADYFDEANLSNTQKQEIIEYLPNFLLVRYLDERHYFLGELLRLIDCIQIKSNSETEFNIEGKIIRYPYAFEVINLENLGKFIINPSEAFRNIYITPFDRNTVVGAKAFTDKLFPKIGRITQALGAISVYGIKPAYGIDFGTIGNEMASGALTVKWRTPLNELYFGTTLLYSPFERGNLGWVIAPFGELALKEILGNYFFDIKSSLSVGGIIIGDNGNIEFDSANDLAKVNAELFALKLPESETGLSYLIGEKEGTRLEIGKISIGGAFEATTSKINFDVHFNIEEAKFVLSAKGQDGFISSILPDEGVEILFDFLMGYSTKKSLYFGVNAGLELVLPLHLEILNTLKIDEVYLKIKTQDYGLKAEVSLAGGVSFGPLDITFKEIGLKSKFDWTSPDKNIGFADLSLGFKPPNGVGLTIDAGAVIGGGYVFFDYEKEEYAGAMELTIAGFISAKAIGLITTKMPDGSKGFSMLIIIMAEFIPAFQLGFGFTLMGVGGLLGLNRTVRIDPLRDSVRTGAVNNILFPQNVIANAPRIISDLNTIFPTYEGKFLIGPMAKIGWGTPTLISLSLGLIIEIPGNIAILGVLRVTLPEERLPLVKIQIAFVGIVDFDKKMFSFDASLFESTIIGLTLEGDMAVRLKWGDSPDFLLTVGGFHPSFTPPPLSLPTLRRLAISILNESYAKIRVECYLAVTSNTVQFGAKAELFFGLSECSINGYIGFDALFQFNPFYFIIDLSAGFSLSAFGMDVMSVSIRMSLEGPTPWVAKGTGSISLFFFDISADFNETWGDSKKVSLPDIAILPRFIEEIKENQNWSTALSTDKNTSVTLRKFKESENIVTADESTLVMHPSGTLVIQQKLLPLNVNIVKIGNQRTSDVKRINVFTASSNGNFLSVKEIKESYAIGQYQELSNAEKLSKPSFQKETGGIEISFDGNSIAHGKMVRKVLAYELTIIDKEPVNPLILGRFYVEFVAFFTNFLRGNSISKSSMSRNYLDKLQPVAEKLKVNQEGYSIVNQADNTLFEGRQFSSEMAATSFYQDILAKNPSMKSELQVVPNFELQES